MDSIDFFLNKLRSLPSFFTPQNSPDSSFPLSFFQPPLENPDFRLTGAIIHKELTLDTFSQNLEIYCIQGVALDKRAKSTFFRKQESEGTVILYYRNCLAKILWLDDQLRLQNKDFDENQKKQIESFLKQVSVHSKEIKDHLVLKDSFGELVRMHTALKFRLRFLEEPLSQEEKIKLFSTLHHLRKKEVLHLMLPSKSELLNMSISKITSLKKANYETRLNNLDLICPLNIGLSSQELDAFVLNLPKASQEELGSLIQKRKNAVSSDLIWDKLINKRIEEKRALHMALDVILNQTEKDFAELAHFPDFSRTLLEHGSFFFEDFFTHCHIMKITSFKSYFTSPHIIILLAEQHLNKQIYAAGERLKELTKDSPILLVRSSLDVSSNWIPANTIPFHNTYVPDPIQRLVGREQLRRLTERIESSSLTEENKISYLPEKGLCQYNPTLIPEKIENYQPFDDSKFEDSFTPAVSFSTPESSLLGTHAFVELYFGHKRYAPGKYSTFNFSYDKVNTYLKIATFVLPKILKAHEDVIFSPDPALGYKGHTRHIATLNTPLKINPKQKEAMYGLLRENYLGEKGESFVVHTKNCTTITEDFLRIAGVNLPCRAPLSTLLRISYPSWAPLFKWIADHPQISDPILQFLGHLLGAEKNNPLTVQSLNNIATPYIPRIWVELKNCVEEIEKIG